MDQHPLSEEHGSTHPMRHVPNALSVLRLILAIAFPFLAPQWWLAAVVTAGISDAADGIIARRYQVGSDFGGMLDAIADKVFVLSVLLTLVVVGPADWWHVLLVLLRDLAVAVVALYAIVVRDWPAFRRMRPDVSGKLATGFIFAWFITVTAGWDQLQLPLFAMATSLSGLAAVVYLSRFVRALHQRARRRSDTMGQ